MIEDLLKKIDDSYTIKQSAEMIAIPSVVGEEADLAEYLWNELESLGLETELHVIEKGRPNIYGKLKGSDNGRRLHFNGHTDTVPVVDGWDTDPFKPVTNDNKMYGLGS